jgi:hypothetical protein
LGKSTGGSYSGDSVNIETRWAYTDFQLPWVENKARTMIGLQPFRVNPWLWEETAMGVNFRGAYREVDYQLAWMRTFEVNVNSEDIDNSDDLENFLARVDFKPAERLKTGLFVLYEKGDPKSSDEPINPREYAVKFFADSVDLNLFNFGIDGSYSVPLNTGNLFFNWDLIYEIGNIDDATFDDSEFSGTTVSEDFDVRAWFAHADVGYNRGKTKLTYTFWYASGDDDATDNDFDGYLSIDVDRFDSLVLFENYTDDNYFSERPYMLDKGFIMNKLALEYQATPKCKLGLAGMYMMTAEDIEYIDTDGVKRDRSHIGFEMDGFISYMLYENVELAVNAGYLFAGDAMDAFEGDFSNDAGAVAFDRDGNSDENIFLSGARIRYRF